MSPAAGALRARRASYWLRVRLITLALLFIWFGTTFAAAVYARQLNQYSLLGFPLGFYLNAQGALLVYLLIVGIYAKIMNRMDRAERAAEKAAGARLPR